jgi:hypothetical protein
MDIRTALNIVEAAQSPSIRGLPPGIAVRDRTLQQALDRGAFSPEARPARGDGYDVALHPADPGEMKTYVPRKSRPEQIAYYDPRHADLEDLDDDEPLLHRTIPRPKAHVQDTIEDEAGIIYRGVSAEEFERFEETGVIVSRGEYNFPGQEGLTYWATDARTAISYANSFAPAAFKPLPGRPCYVFAARMPDPADTRHVKGTGSNEVGVARPITSDEITAIWRGTVFDYQPGSYSLRRNGYEGDEYTVGSSSSPAAWVHWERIV